MGSKKIILRRVGFYLLLAGCLAALLNAGRLDMALGGQLGEKGVGALAILAFAVLGWMLELAPISVTSLFVLVLIPVSGLMDFKEAVRDSFGDSVFAFFLGVLLLSAAFRETNLGKSITIGLFRVFGRRPKQVLLGLLLAGCLLAMWITEVASAAILFPIAMSVTEQSKGRKDHAQLGKLLLLAVAWGPAFGGVGTPIATGANLIALNYLEELGGITITFLDWMKIGVPIALTLLGAGWLLLSSQVRDNGELELDTQIPPWTRREWLLLFYFLLAIVLWVWGGGWGISSHHVALLIAVLLFLPGLEVLEWKTALKSVSWDSIILICVGVVIGELLYQYGVAEWIALKFFSKSLLSGGPFLTALYIVLATSVLKVLFSSNTVSGIIMTPIMISLAASLGMGAWGLVAPCIFSTALSLLVITSSPVNVVAYAGGYFTPVDLLKNGIPMTLLTGVIIAGWLTVFGVG